MKMKNLLLTSVLILMLSNVSGQNQSDFLTGKVSFLSTQNVYVRFVSTIGISAGDTLFKNGGGKLNPALIVSNLSSTSCVCSQVSGILIVAGDEIFARRRFVKPKKESETKQVVSSENKVLSDTLRTEKKKENKTPIAEKVRGSISAFSYSDFSNTIIPGSTRFRYNINASLQHISNTGFSFENYISFSHKTGDWASVKDNLFTALKIYSLSVKYEFSKTAWISAGRMINPNLSSIGAMDGIEFEKTINNISLGVVAGTRPDYSDYGFNKNLLQYGGYVAYHNITAESYNEASVAFMQQTNNGKTDRRFLYFQYSNSIVKNLFFTGTFEVDLYKLNTDSINGNHSSNTIDPTGLFLSLRYRSDSKLSLSVSYDARKNIMYYETYKSYIDRILESEVRQGIRFQANYSFSPKISIGIQPGFRYLKSDLHPTENLYTYLTFSQIPWINATATLSGTLLKTSYLNGNIYALSMNKSIFHDKVQLGAGYRYMNYSYPENRISVPQNIAEVNLLTQITSKASFSVNYEGTFEKKDKYNRLFFQIRRSF
jgi:hypothetical protein